MLSFKEQRVVRAVVATEMLSHNLAKEWLDWENSYLDGYTPREFIELGRVGYLIRLIETIDELEGDFDTSDRLIFFSRVTKIPVMKDEDEESSEVDELIFKDEV